MVLTLTHTLKILSWDLALYTGASFKFHSFIKIDTEGTAENFHHVYDVKLQNVKQFIQINAQTCLYREELYLIQDLMFNVNVV